MGRAGRSGNSAVCVFLRRKGERTPKEMRPFLKSDSTTCLKRGLVQIFTLSNPDGERFNEYKIKICALTSLIDI